MSVRSLAQAFVKGGKAILQKKFGKLPARKLPTTNFKGVGRNPNVYEGAVNKQGRQILGRIFPTVGVRTLASELRRRAATHFGNQHGCRLWPTFAFGFAGLSLQSLRGESHQEALSAEIRDIFRGKTGKYGCLLDKVRELSLDRFEFGSLIGQGCNAAVYEARFRDVDLQLEHCPEDIKEEDDVTMTTITDILDTDTDIDIVVIDADREIDLGPSSDINSNVEFGFTMVTTTVVSDDDELDDIEDGISDGCVDGLSDEDLSIVAVDEDNSNDLAPDVFAVEREVIFFMGEETTDEVTETEQTEENPSELFPLAIKMMYNYDVESNAENILRVMAKETVPSKLPRFEESTNLFRNGNRVRLKTLSEHPNVVDMLGVFVDPVPALSDGMTQYPAALPQRLNPHGFGRNKTMFIVMKKYTETLREYLSEQTPNVHTRCLLLAQLLEGTVHLGNHGIAHRDVKSDNILLDCHNEGTKSEPLLVFSDFGCCLADPMFGLKLPYPTADFDRGGNRSLMAPEIASTLPGPNAVLDYSKADLWSVGTLVYELFGLVNPFYGQQGSSKKLDSATFTEEDLPDLPGDVPGTIKFLSTCMLRPNPEQRPSAALVANLLQIYLWFPDWLVPGNKPTGQEVMEHMLIIVADILFKQRLDVTAAEFLLKFTFLKRFDASQVMDSLEFYHSQF